MNPQPNTKLIDVASGTGDIANLFLDNPMELVKYLCRTK